MPVRSGDTLVIMKVEGAISVIKIKIRGTAAICCIIKGLRRRRQKVSDHF